MSDSEKIFFSNYFACSGTAIVDNQAFDAAKKYRFAKWDGMENVRDILFMDCDMPRFPKIINWNILPTLQTVHVTYSKVQIIRKADLAGLERIEKLLLTNNSLEYLPGDLFDDFMNLTEASFYSNKIKYIDKDLIKSLKKLDVVNLRANSNIDRYYILKHGHSKQHLEKDIIKKCKVPNKIKEKMKLLSLERGSDDAMITMP